MPFDGHIENGRVVLDAPVPLPDGTPVRVEAVAPGISVSHPDTASRTLAERYPSIVGVNVNLPPDAALNHDHYLYGAEKR